MEKQHADPLFQPGQRLRIFVGEAQEWQGKPLHRAILELSWRHGMAGATVWRGIEGFGPHHHLSTERFVDLTENLPVIVEIVDRAEKIEQILPHLDAMVPRGMITVSPVRIVQKRDQP
jgi:PII-like signaling protein